MAKKKHRISTEGESGNLASSPFDGLSSEGLPTQLVPAHQPVESTSKRKNKPKEVRMRRETSGRGGKEVTVLWDFKGLPDGERKPLLDALKRRCGTGGKLVGQEMEIQGDQRKFLEGYFEGHGFRVIWAGG